MAGRSMQIGDAPWQRISYVTDSTHLTLEASWLAASVTGQSYKIWKREYQMPPIVARVLRFVDLANPTKPIGFYDPQEFHEKFGWGDSFGSNPNAYTQFGTSDYANAFIGSTVFASVTSTANSPIIDFASTVALVTAMSRGDRLRIGDSTTATAFTVERILTDTKLALSTHVAVSLAAVSATAFSLDRLTIRFFEAVDAAKVFYWAAQRRYSDLIADGDYIEEGWYEAIKKGAIAKAAGLARDPREQQKILEYETAKANLTRNQYKALNPVSRMRVHIPDRYGSAGLFGSKRDEP